MDDSKAQHMPEDRAPEIDEAVVNAVLHSLTEHRTRSHGLAAVHPWKRELLKTEWAEVQERLRRDPALCAYAVAKVR